MGVSADAPSLDSAYKLVEYDGRPMLKLSEHKATEPGRKQVFRGAKGDVIGLRDEPLPDDHEPLLVPVMSHGRRTGPPRTLEPPHGRSSGPISNSSRRTPRGSRTRWPPRPRTSEALDRLTDDAKADALKRAGLA